MDKNECRLADFEKMLAAVEDNLRQTEQKMKKLKDEGKENSATYRQLMANKLQYKIMLSLYRLYGLIED